MTEERVQIEPVDFVGVKLLAGEEAEVVTQVLQEDYPEAKVARHPGYIAIDVPEEMKVDLKRVEERLGRPYDAPTFLVILSSYYGRINVEDEKVTFTSELLDV